MFNILNAVTIEAFNKEGKRPDIPSLSLSSTNHYENSFYLAGVLDPIIRFPLGNEGNSVDYGFTADDIKSGKALVKVNGEIIPHAVFAGDESPFHTLAYMGYHDAKISKQPKYLGNHPWVSPGCEYGYVIELYDKESPNEPKITIKLIQTSEDDAAPPKEQAKVRVSMPPDGD